MRAFLVLALFGLLSSVWAEENPLELRQRLHSEVVGQRILTYKQVWEALVQLDADPEHPEMVMLIYTRRLEPADRQDHGQNDPDSWNREHLWPKSHGFPDQSNPAYTDLNNLRPEDRSVNTARNDRDYDDGGKPHGEAVGVLYDADSWEVPDEVKGDVARAIFYMALRYDGSQRWRGPDGRLRAEPKLVIVEGDSPETRQPFFGHLSTLLRWNRLDPPDERERKRDEGVASLQGKHNPFVAHPEYVDLLWGVRQVSFFPRVCRRAGRRFCRRAWERRAF